MVESEVERREVGGNKEKEARSGTIKLYDEAC